MRTRRTVRLLGALEATTYLVLLAGALQHRLLDGPDVAALLGPVHGVAFLAFAGVVVEARSELGWDVRRTLGLLAAAVIPFGGYAVGRHL